MKVGDRLTVPFKTRPCTLNGIHSSDRKVVVGAVTAHNHLGTGVAGNHEKYRLTRKGLSAMH